jgi:LDH2 family malate/lactate/ureidoglycolate dehydrogenase
MVRISEEPLNRLCIAILRAAGTPLREAKTVSEILVKTSLHGVDSHGVRLITRYISEIKSGQLSPKAKVKVLRNTATTAMLDDGGGFGFVAAKKAMEMAIRKAKRYKMGSVGLQGRGHIGALYYYSMMAVRENMVGVTLCKGTGHGMAPYGAAEGTLGINPLAVGIPAGSELPIVLDMATTVVAAGHLDVMAVRGQKVPEGWLLRQDGTWETSPATYRKGESSLVGFGYPSSEYKGSGLCTIVDALAGGIGAGCSLDEKGYGHIFMAVDPEGYCPLDEFKARIDSMIGHVKSAKKRPGFKDVLLPGEPEWLEEQRRQREGILVDDAWWKSILKTAEELGIDAQMLISG